MEGFASCQIGCVLDMEQWSRQAELYAAASRSSESWRFGGDIITKNPALFAEKVSGPGVKEQNRIKSLHWVLEAS